VTDALIINVKWYTTVLIARTWCIRAVFIGLLKTNIGFASTTLLDWLKKSRATFSSNQK